MLKHPELTRGRLARFLRTLDGQIYPESAPVKLMSYHAPGRISYAEALRGTYKPAQVGQTFGPGWATHWFRVTAVIPVPWNGRAVHFRWNANSEACVWVDGQPRQGLSGAVAGQFSVRTEYPLREKARGGERIEFYLEMACNSLFGYDTKAAIGTLTQAEISVFDAEAWSLFWDMTVVNDLATHLPDGEARKAQALATANACLNLAVTRGRAGWREASRRLNAFYTSPNGPSAHEISAMGHAHLDTAWLWPVAETKRKAYRTFSSMLSLAEEYPEFIFAVSQAAQCAWIRDEHPALWRRFKNAVKQGIFAPVGGTWVEPDCNLPSGESLVRQFLFGQRFFKQEFGRRSSVFWNPDVFGYCGQLPQIMKICGISYFMTQKLSWNQFNKPPSHTFLWEGLDGSRVLTHFPPADTYCAIPDVKTLSFHARNFKDPERATESCLLFGYGDGGGGATRAMLEQTRRLKDCSGLPRLEIRSPEAFFARCEKDLRDPLVWRGELYFELHRGTYTTQAANKRDNRRGEALLHDAEALATVAHALAGRRYPAAKINELWQTLLLNQFHDIIPGSSIGEVYKVSSAEYAKLLPAADQLRCQATAAFVPLQGMASKKPAGWTVFNTLVHERAEVVEMPEASGLKTAQKSHNGHALAWVETPSFGFAPVTAADSPGDTVSARNTASGIVLENALLRASFDHGGRLVSLWDKGLDREAVAAKSRANHFVIYHDVPNYWDAWDVEAYHLETRAEVPEAESFLVLEDGPLRAMVEFKIPISPASHIVQRISLGAGMNRLEFDTNVDWHETERFLKVEFPVAVREEFATYDTPFGHVRRPTHFNTSWDMARFEVCAHKWADFSESGFGVALLNDSKYGYAVHGHVMRLSLLRAPQMPDKEADQGAHRFRYALMTHPGDFRTAGVILEAANFNAPLLLRRGTSADAASWMACDMPSFVVETIKKAEDSNDCVIRGYESWGGRGRATLSTALPVRRAFRSNALEDDGPAVSCSAGKIRFDVKPFEIITLKLSSK